MGAVGSLGVERVTLPGRAFRVFLALRHEGQEGCAAAGASLTAATNRLVFADALTVGRALFVALGEPLGAAVAGAWLEVGREALARNVVAGCQEEDRAAHARKLHGPMVGESAHEIEPHAPRQFRLRLAGDRRSMRSDYSDVRRDLG